MESPRKGVAACLRNLVSDFFDYETPVILRTKAKRVGVIYRIIQTATLVFFFLYSIVYLKGYQLLSNSAASVILTRIKAAPLDTFAHLVYDEKFLHYCNLEIESNNPEDPMAYFHGGSDISIPFDFAWMSQKQTNCPEDPLVPGAKCDPKNNRCARNKALPMGNGKMTGKCVPAIITNDTVCEVHAWCPVISSLTPTVDMPQNDSGDHHEKHSPPNTKNKGQNSTGSGGREESTPDTPLDLEPLAEEHAEGVDAILDIAKEAESDYYESNRSVQAGNGTGAGPRHQFIRMKLWTSIRDVTIVIKNPVEFLVFEESRSNYNTTGIPCWRNPNYDKDADSCPIFSVEDILEEVASKIDNVSAKDLMQTGGIVSCIITWECNFDSFDESQSCDIGYIFTRVDQPRSGVGQRTLFLSDHESGDHTKRLAVRLSFIRFIFNIEASAGKFNAIQLLFKLGAAFGIFSIGTLICEYIFLNTDWLVKRTVVEMKYLEPTDGSQRTGSFVVVQSRTEEQEDNETPQ